MNVLTLIRGCSGSGKSTIADALADSNNPNIFEADNFFYDNNGVYNFDASKLKEAHDLCIFETEQALQLNTPSVIVANTFTRVWEMKKYEELAHTYGYVLNIIECHGNFENVHNVPSEVVNMQRERFETVRVVDNRIVKVVTVRDICNESSPEGYYSMFSDVFSKYVHVRYPVANETFRFVHFANALKNKFLGE